MSAEVETMFYVREKFWHGLGVRVENALSSMEALIAAGLNWNVVQQEIYTQDGFKIPGYLANVRDSDRKVLGVVGERYQIVQNREAFAFTDELLGKGVRYETAGSLKEGKRIWILARLPKAYRLAEDKVIPYLVFSNTHDGSGVIKVAMTPIRVICNNTLNLALQTASRMWTAKHTGDMSAKMEDAKMTLFMAEHYMEELMKESDRLSRKKVSDAEVREYIKMLLPIPADATEVTEQNIIRLRKNPEAFFLKGEILMDEKLEYADFKEKLTGEVERFLPPESRMEHGSVRKVNLGEQDIITIFSEEEAAIFSPCYYLSNLYKRYLSGCSPEGLAREMIVRFLQVNTTDQRIKTGRIFSFEEAREYIFYQVISGEKNQELLGDVLHDDFLDLSIVYRVLLFGNGGEEIGSAKIMAGQMRDWGVTREEVKEAAKKNTQRLFPAVRMRMGSIVAEAMKDSDSGMILNPEHMVREFLPELNEVYVLTNRRKTDGFAVVFYKDILKEIAEEKGSDLYILPSSIHEAIVLPAKEKESAGELRKIVDEANRICVLPEDWLSDMYTSIQGNRTGFV